MEKIEKRLTKTDQDKQEAKTLYELAKDFVLAMHKVEKEVKTKN